MRRTLPVTCLILALTRLAEAAEPDFSLTIYSSAQPGQISVEALANYGMAIPGYALVRDRRRMSLQPGIGNLRFSDVAKRIDPTTVSFSSLTDPDGTRVLEQNYEFDLVSQQKLLERYVGASITVDQPRGDHVDTVTGTLLSASGGLILQKDSGEIVTLASYSNVRFPSLPGGLITKPTLAWQIDAKRGGEHDARVSYQTRGMTWWSDYNVTLRNAGDACEMDLSAWVSIVNQSGASFPKCQLKLVAGEVHRAPAPAPALHDMRMRKSEAVMAAAADGFQSSELFEYHLYTLGRRSDLPDNSTKQLELFPAALGVACKKQLVFSATKSPYRYWNQPVYDQSYAATTEGSTGAYLEFENRETNRMGMPLPAGRIRVNKAADDGTLEFIGEDLIKHTPRNETVRIKLGNAFDIAGERKQTSFAYNDKADTIDESFEISVRNRKKTAETIIVREYLSRWSNWKVTSQSHDFVKRDAETIDFVLQIPADGEAKVSYSVRYDW